MNLEFVDRESELATLMSLLGRKSSALVLVYGRRRVGKTRLVQEFMRDRESLYLYVPNAEEKTILTEFSRVVEGEFFRGFVFRDFSSFLEYLSKRCNEGTIVAIDEFQRLGNIDGAMSLLQRFWDEKMAKGHCLLILSGSSIGAVEGVALRGDAPLYGRRTATLKLEPLKFLDLSSWFGNLTPDDLVKIYGAFGGTPAYLEHVDERQGAEANIVEKILSKRSPLHDEPEMLMMEELRAPQRYMDMLSALAMGKNTVSHIADATGISRENCTAYLKTLETLDLIERITPVTEPEARRGLYRMKDPFFVFWFRFVRPGKRQLELGLERNVWEGAREAFNAHLGGVFEKICSEVLIEMARKDLLPMRLDRVGTWWWKGTEIDLLGLDSRQGQAMALEAKWADLSYAESKTILARLSAKVQQVRGIRRCMLGIMGKSIRRKGEIRDEGYIALDLHDVRGPEHLPDLSEFGRPQWSLIQRGNRWTPT